MALSIVRVKILVRKKNNNKKNNKQIVRVDKVHKPL